MCHKRREESDELRIWRALNARFPLADEEARYFHNLLKVWEGEKKFDSYTENVSKGNVILNDLLFEVSNTIFQVDSIMISGETLFLYEIKNYEGDYYYENDRFFTKSQKEISNPLIQLKRTETLLRQLLHKHGYSIPIVSNVVFINPEFFLYQAPLQLPIIHWNQLNRHILHLQQNTYPLKKRSKLIAEKLNSLHLEENPYKKIPSYQYEEIQKGILCAGCGRFGVRVVGMGVECTFCNHIERFEMAVLRTIEEFRVLFPNSKITTKAISEMCGGIASLKKIRRILERNFKMNGVHQWAFYNDMDEVD